MQIPPERRRRALFAHHYRQQGQSLREIADQLDCSPATVRSDLQLLETHWNEIAVPAADDFLVELHFLLQHRLTRLLQANPYGGYDELDSALRYYEAHTRELAILLRENRQLTEAIHRRAPERAAETTPELITTEHPDPTISQPKQEIVESEEVEAVSSDHPLQDVITDPDLNDETLTEFVLNSTVELFPHLQGQSPDEILRFLYQATPADLPDDPLPAHAAAAAG